MSQIAIHWFRRDLRVHDNTALYHAFQSGHPVLPIFIFDKNILDELEDKNDARVTFIYDEIDRLRSTFQDHGSDVKIFYDTPEGAWKKLLDEYEVAEVYVNRDYEPYALQRDKNIAQLVEEEGGSLFRFKDQVIFDHEEVMKDDGDPYVVFTPYKRTWLDRVKQEEKEGNDPFHHYPSETLLQRSMKWKDEDPPSLEEMGFERSDVEIPSRQVSQKVIKVYDKKRNFPAEDGTSRLGVHFRFGTISIREKVRKSSELNRTYLNELIWREFYSNILYHFPKVVDTSFREKYDNIEWRNNEADFELWKEGKTGYPIVDAGMRQLRQTGYMHNRVRMITASFLTKHLLIDWRWGEAWFARWLLDYELASNNGGWQWAAGCGTDAAPYFRIFNPYTQREKFDKNWEYVKEWVPEIETEDYPEPMVDHKEARERCLKVYKEALDNQ
ncbi:MAG: deoxyribodipyrimidine photo-lyase [Saprospiraceae bacterium]|nr:deoxyribodipyrimidine photo-lyase [Saprospiraceae bacterium]